MLHPVPRATAGVVRPAPLPPRPRATPRRTASAAHERSPKRSTGRPCHPPRPPPRPRSRPSPPPHAQRPATSRLRAMWATPWSATSGSAPLRRGVGPLLRYAASGPALIRLLGHPRSTSGRSCARWARRLPPRHHTGAGRRARWLVLAPATDVASPPACRRVGVERSHLGRASAGCCRSRQRGVLRWPISAATGNRHPRLRGAHPRPRRERRAPGPAAETPLPPARRLRWRPWRPPPVCRPPLAPPRPCPSLPPARPPHAPAVLPAAREPCWPGGAPRRARGAVAPSTSRGAGTGFVRSWLNRMRLARSWARRVPASPLHALLLRTRLLEHAGPMACSSVPTTRSLSAHEAVDCTGRTPRPAHGPVGGDGRPSPRTPTCARATRELTLGSPLLCDRGASVALQLGFPDPPPIRSPSDITGTGGAPRRLRGDAPPSLAHPNLAQTSKWLLLARCCSAMAVALDPPGRWSTGRYLVLAAARPLVVGAAAHGHRQRRGRSRRDARHGASRCP